MLVKTEDQTRKAADAQASVTASWTRACEANGSLRACAYLPPEAPRAGDGPLAGVSVGMKDLIDTFDMPTCYGSPLFKDHRPAADAWIVARLKAFGATIVGKTVTTEFAWLAPGPTVNPWNGAHTPGGSSSGSAAAVAAGLVDVAIGTQTFGSVIRPAAFCGIVGFKPTFGLLPRDGIHPLSGSLDHVGLFARSVEEIGEVFGLLSQRAAATGDIASLRFAVPPLADSVIEPAQAAAFQTAVASLEAAGAQIARMPLPAAFDSIRATADTLAAFEAAAIFAPLLREHPDGIGTALRALVERGAGIDRVEYLAALARQLELRAIFAREMAGFDAVLTIPAPGEAPRGIASTGDGRFCIPWSVLGVPAITLPVAAGPAELPLGLQIAGHWRDDAMLLHIARLCRKCIPYPAFAARTDLPV